MRKTSVALLRAATAATTVCTGSVGAGVACAAGGGGGGGAAAAAAASVRVLRLPGLIPWLNATRMQRALVDTYTQDQLVLCQHPPTYTEGRRNNITDEERARLQQLGAHVHESKRGGQMTFHGPGQLVGYPIVKVPNYGGVRCYVHKLEETLIETCAHFGIDAGRSPDTGVWVGDAKIAAIGVQVSRRISWHGFALNCNTDLAWFDQIVPCGIADKGVTSISKQLGREVTVEEVIPVVEECFGRVFGTTMVAASQDTIHDALNLANATNDSNTTAKR
ncbi:lipoate-protein ligase b [Salpingoeca rosetta]|uniref:lipoyl(octanoyl) transferase n=1 Tax=Salpingoeca rosetta (strain ATCC 50818 / BSB-021) TaxID=946362 RepID=F2ULK8_SALR5|nr:lipoate-protein ligase b [Salpingoeca rosetta]EGD78007.1 lipoate-protein ligase b [Salpingoeca rosetta]|eukprot:XP_004990069.1 lipoate-protein ligase b [Salpingoeca rosetta]